MLTLSMREGDRLAVLREVEDGLVSPADGTRKLGLSARRSGAFATGPNAKETAS